LPGTFAGSVNRTRSPSPLLPLHNPPPHALSGAQLFCDTSAELEGVQTSEWWAVATAILAANKKGGAEKEETKVDDLAEGEAF